MSFTSPIRRRSRAALVIAALLGLGAVATPSLGAVELAQPTSYAVGDGPISVAIDDFDGDLDPDVAVSNNGSDDITVRLGEPGAGLGPAASFPAGDALQGVVAGDLNGDSDPDLAVAATAAGTVRVLLGGPGGTFGPPTAMPVGLTTSLVAIGDVTGDGIPDLVVSRSAENRVSVLPGHGDGTFGAATVLITGSSPNAIALADLDGDGLTDIAVANEFSNNVTVYRAVGGGAFSGPQSFAAGTGPFDIATGDFDGDRVLDLAVADIGPAGHLGPDTVAVLRGNGSGTFLAPVLHTVGDRPGQIAAGDLDHDGDLDLVASNSRSGTLSVLHGTAGTGFAPATSVPTPSNPQEIRLADLDASGSLDLVAASFDTDAVAVFPNLSVNDAPVARDDSYTVDEDEALAIPAAEGVLANDSDPDGGALTIGPTPSFPAHGELTLASDGSFAYVPDANFAGTDSFAYLAEDPYGLTSEATVTIAVTGRDDPPVARDDAYRGIEDSLLTVAAPGVLANDSDPDGPLTASAALIAFPSSGELTLEADGSFTYRPAPDFSGTESFTYVAVDPIAGESVPATVTMTIRPNSGPQAADDAYTTAQGSPLVVSAPGVLANDADTDGDALSATMTAGPVNGSVTLEADGSFVYTPAPGFAGTDRFFYNVFDGSDEYDAGIAVITVTPVAPPAAISIADAQVAEGNRGSAALVFTLTRTGSTAASTRVDYRTGDGTATTADRDYRAKSGRVTFRAGQASATVEVPVVGDRVPELDETLHVVLNNSTGAPIGDGEAVGTILDDD